MKYPIEKNTVQETLVIPMYGRKMCSGLYPSLYRDETAIRLLEQIDYDFSALAKKSKSTMQRFGFLEVAMRQNDLAIEVRDYLKTHPNAAVVNLGCGLDDIGRSCDNGVCRIYNLDFPDVIAVRNALLPAGEREENIPCNLNDTAWFGRIDVSGGVVFFAAGVFYYFLAEQVQALVRAMADAFPGGKLVFDAANRKAVKLMLKTWNSFVVRIFRTPLRLMQPLMISSPSLTSRGRLSPVSALVFRLELPGRTISPSTDRCKNAASSQNSAAFVL